MTRFALVGGNVNWRSTRELAALADLGDLQLDLARLGVRAPRPIHVATRAILGRRSPRAAPTSSETWGSIICRDGLDRLADHVGVLVEQHLPETSSIVIL